MLQRRQTFVYLITLDDKKAYLPQNGKPENLKMTLVVNGKKFRKTNEIKEHPTENIKATIYREVA